MPAADQANASQADPPGLTFSVSVSALQHLIIEVLRRPVEFTQNILISVVAFSVAVYWVTTIEKKSGTAAVIGRNFELAVLEAAAGIDSDPLLDALEEAERAQLITSATSGREIQYTFAHELIRQTLHANPSLPRRQRLHLRVAEAIEAVHTDATEKHAAVLAHHFYQAGSVADAEKTLRYLTLAGKQALTAAAFEDAVGLFTTALSFEQLDEKERADLMFERGGALRSLAQADDAIADWTEALSAYERLPTPRA